MVHYIDYKLHGHLSLKLTIVYYNLFTCASGTAKVEEPCLFSILAAEVLFSPIFCISPSTEISSTISTLCTSLFSTTTDSVASPLSSPIEMTPVSYV